MKNKKIRNLLVISLLSFSITGCNNSTSNISSSNNIIQVNESIKDGEYVREELVRGIIFTGTIKNKMPDGSCYFKYILNKIEINATFKDGLNITSKVTYKDKKTFIGKILMSYVDFSFKRVEGIQQIDDTHYYSGKFVNDLFNDDNGKITTHKYNLSGGIDTYGSEYSSKFINGNSEGQKVTYYFPSYFNESYGAWYYENCEIENYEPKLNQTCKIKMKLADDTFYKGEVNRKEAAMSDGSTYLGDFVNNKYQGFGKVIYNDGSTFEGVFYNGTNKGQYGTKYYANYFTNNVGIHYYYGKMKTTLIHETGVTGYGKFKFDDLSSYYGDLYHPTINEFHRFGHGIMDFTERVFNADFCGRYIHERLYKFEGEFDYNITGWMYGNGIMYYTDSNGSLLGYIEGFFGSWTRLDDWKGNFDINKNVHPDFRNLDRLDYLPNEASAQKYDTKYQNKKSTDILFLGDSYFDMWQSSYGISGKHNYESYTANMDTMNIGIGGTTSGQWNESFFNRLTKNLDSANKIVVHLGFNDSHIGLGATDTIESIKTLSSVITTKYPNAKVYLLTVEPSPCFANYWNKDNEINEGIREYCSNSNDNIYLIDTAKVLHSGNDNIPYNKNYFVADQVHLNETGYELWLNTIFNEINK